MLLKYIGTVFEVNDMDENLVLDAIKYIQTYAEQKRVTS